MLLIYRLADEYFLCNLPTLVGQFLTPRISPLQARFLILKNSSTSKPIQFALFVRINKLTMTYSEFVIRGTNEWTGFFDPKIFGTISYQ